MNQAKYQATSQSIPHYRAYQQSTMKANFSGFQHESPSVKQRRIESNTTNIQLRRNSKTESQIIPIANTKFKQIVRNNSAKNQCKKKNINK